MIIVLYFRHKRKDKKKKKFLTSRETHMDSILGDCALSVGNNSATYKNFNLYGFFFSWASNRGETNDKMEMVLVWCQFM